MVFMDTYIIPRIGKNQFHELSTCYNSNLGAVNPFLRSKMAYDQDLGLVPSTLASNSGVFMVSKGREGLWMIKTRRYLTVDSNLSYNNKIGKKSGATIRLDRPSNRAIWPSTWISSFLAPVGWEANRTRMPWGFPSIAHYFLRSLWRKDKEASIWASIWASSAFENDN